MYSIIAKNPERDTDQFSECMEEHKTLDLENIRNDDLAKIISDMFPEIIGERNNLPEDIAGLISRRSINDDWFYEVKKGLVKTEEGIEYGERRIKKRFSEELTKLIIKKIGLKIEGDDANYFKQKQLYALFNKLSGVKQASEYEPPKLNLDDVKIEQMQMHLNEVVKIRREIQYTVEGICENIPDLPLAQLMNAPERGISKSDAIKVFKHIFSSKDNKTIDFKALYTLIAIAIIVTQRLHINKFNVVERCGSGYGHSEACAAGCIGCSFVPENFDDYKVLTRPPSIPPEIMVPDAVWKVKYRGLHHYKVVMGVGELRYNSRPFTDAIKVIREANKRLAMELGAHKKTTCASLGVVNDHRIVEALKAQGIELEHYNANFEWPAVYYDGRAIAIYEDGERKRLAPFSTTHSFEDKIKTFHMMMELGISSCSGVLIEKCFPEFNSNGSALLRVVTDDGEEFTNQLTPFIELFDEIRKLGLESAPFNARVKIITDHLRQDMLLEEEYIALLSLFRLIHPKIKRIVLNAGPETGGSFLPLAMKIGGGISAAGNYLTSGITESERNRIEKLSAQII